ncbi:MAG: hypothetical protein DSY77_09075 [Bacteroidetes bacterium]|nr:MAG: hypothetical protein DSY77_09075 [Bacteroidota bacterium]
MKYDVPSPYKSAIYGLVFWLFIYLLAPVKYAYPLSFAAISLLLFSYVLFFAGYWFGNAIKLVRKPYEVPIERKWLFNLFLFIAIGSAILIACDKFLLRGVSLSNGAFANREILQDNSPTIIGIVGNIFKAAVFISLFLYFQFGLKNKVLLWLNYGILGYFIIENFFVGSRSIPVFYTVLFVLILVHFKKVRLRLKYILGISILGIVFFVFLTELYISRTIEFMGTRSRAIEFILMKGSYMDYTKVDKEFITFVMSLDSYYLQSFFVGLISFLVYYLHSVIEFSYLIDNFSSDAQMGSHTFFVISKFFQLIFGTYDGRSLDYVPRLGKYTTFFGDIYMDFKYLLSIFMFFFGYWQARLYKTAVVKSNFIVIPLLLFLCILNFIFPVFNLISGGNGIYLIIGFIILGLFYKILSAYNFTFHVDKNT